MRAEPAQHFVHRAGQGGNLVLGRRDLDAWFPAVLGQCGDLAPQALDRRQGGARQPVGAERRDGDEDPAADGQLPDHLALGGLEPVQGETGDGNPPCVAGQGPGGDPRVFLVDCSRDGDPAGPRLGQLARGKQRRRPRVGARAADTISGINDLDHVLAGRRAGRRRGRARSPVRGQVTSCLAELNRELGVDRPKLRGRQRADEQPAPEGERDGRGDRARERQAQPDRHVTALARHGGAGSPCP